ncbi:MAG: hypothetical protein KJ850_11330 [Gammaproteobacteria bacterium]|nr:hypothetical protein [Gammaproteobacteria bacterium]MBU1625621.1 hypothetical protein [Gammaproteobacteria bacterium]MBU1980881.1 hypothetical protein [Gammaproteobacteria bacterium]
MERFDQPLVDETQPKAHVWTDIGKAEVEHSIFGKAKVRVYRKQDEIRGAVRWTLLTIGMVVGAVWLINDVSRQPEIVYVAPPEQAVKAAAPEPQKPVPVAPQIKPRVTPPIVMSKPVALPQAPFAPVAVSAPAVAKSTPVMTTPVAVAAPMAVAVKPVAPATQAASAVPVISKPIAPKAPAVASSAVTATN